MECYVVATENFTRTELLALVPRLRGFALSLTRSRERAEDLVQDTILRAMTAAHQFQAGTNLQAWMFRILHNLHYSNLRKYRFEIRSFDDGGIPEPSAPPTQENRLTFNEFCRAFTQLSDEHRSALTLVAIDGLSYLQAAKRCGCPTGTIKSRVSRARRALRWILDDEALPQAPPELSIGHAFPSGFASTSVLSS